jgi:hypothetical protein
MEPTSTHLCQVAIQSSPARPANGGGSLDERGATTSEPLTRVPGRATPPYGPSDSCLLPGSRVRCSRFDDVVAGVAGAEVCKDALLEAPE